MIQTVLRLAIDKRVVASVQQDAPSPGLLSAYSRVLVQDSTIIELPGWLFDTFSGVANGAHQVCNARIQATYDLKHMGFEAFSIDAYSKNDVSSAPELELRPGDLVLRDRGYLTVGEIQRHQQARAHFIYRHKTGALYRELQSDEPLDLPELLRRHGSLDVEVALNGKRHLYRLCYERMREATDRDLSLLKFTRYMAQKPQRLVSLTTWLIEGAPASSDTCIALRKYCCYDQRKRLNYHQKQRALGLT